MLATKFLAAMALAFQATAAPGPRDSGLQLKRDNCDADFAILVQASCQLGHNVCEFCCPDGFDVPVDTELDHCHKGHLPYECDSGFTEWHCDDHA
jgi:hypothetical protein